MLQKTTVKPVNIVLILCVLKCAQISISTVLNVKPFLREVFRKKRNFFFCFMSFFLPLLQKQFQELYCS